MPASRKFAMPLWKLSFSKQTNPRASEEKPQIECCPRVVICRWRHWLSRPFVACSKAVMRRQTARAASVVGKGEEKVVLGDPLR
ncbi:hypothetical protein VTO58DRAFT_108513 [Aureobasidium pullulans]